MRPCWMLVALLAAVSAQDNSSYTGYEVLEIMPEDSQKLLLMQFYDENGFDFWKAPRKAGDPTVVMVEPSSKDGFKKFLEDNEVAYSVMIADVQSVMDQENASQLKPRAFDFDAPFKKYPRLQQIYSYLDELAARHPGTVSVYSLGRSYEGRDIRVARLTSGGGSAGGGGGGRPVVFLEAGMHAREWIAPALALHVLRQLLEEPRNADLLAAAEWHVLPVLNVDGYEFSHTTSRFWRKTRSVIPGSRCRGADGNRNFNFHWNYVGASPNPCAETYAGPKPFSEIEVVYLANYLWRMRGRIKLYLSLHSYGGYFLYPWGYTNELPADWKELEALAQAANAAQVAAGGKSFISGSASNVLYEASGGSDDWARAALGVKYAYTVELPGGGSRGFDLPASLIRPTVSSFFPAVRLLALRAAGL